MTDDIWRGVDNELGHFKRKMTKSVVLFLIITFGVACGNLISAIIIAKAAEIALERSAEKLKVEAALSAERLRIEAEKALAESKEKMKDANARMLREQEEARKRAENQRREQEHRQQVQRKLSETCDYWISEYKKYRNDVNRGHRDVACRQAGRPFN